MTCSGLKSFAVSLLLGMLLGTIVAAYSALGQFLLPGASEAWGSIAGLALLAGQYGLYWFFCD